MMVCTVNNCKISAVLCVLMIALTGCSHPSGPASVDQPPGRSSARSAAAMPPGSTISPLDAGRLENPAGRTDAAADAAAIPGTDPAIQRWFLNNGTAKIAFNNALLRAEHGTAAGKSAECQPLVASSRALLNVLPKLKSLSVAGQKLAAAIEVPVSTFGIAASQCVAGDFSKAKSTLDLGIGQQADAQSTVDEILDGDK